MTEAWQSQLLGIEVRLVGVSYCTGGPSFKTFFPSACSCKPGGFTSPASRSRSGLALWYPLSEAYVLDFRGSDEIGPPTLAKSTMRVVPPLLSI